LKPQQKQKTKLLLFALDHLELLAGGFIDRVCVPAFKNGHKKYLQNNI
jgi:hypothetical protein